MGSLTREIGDLVRRMRNSVLTQVFLLVAISIGARALNLLHPPSFDELYHLLAAKSWMSEGTLRIADGEYRRSALFTMMLGWIFEVFGSSLTVARIVVLVPGVALVVALYLWTRRVAGGLAAWSAGLLLALSPTAIDLSQFVRFYTLQALLFWLGAAGVYAVLTRAIPAGKTVVIVCASVAAIVGATHLQLTTLVGVCGLGVWCGIRAAPYLVAWWSKPRLRWALCGLLLLIVLLLLGMNTSGLANFLLMNYQYTAPWSEGTSARFYYWLLADQYPTLWTLLPAIILIGLARRTEPVLYCVCVFSISFVLLSFAGLKAERYISLALPHLFALTGIAISVAAPSLVGLARKALIQTAGLRGNGLGLRLATNGSIAGVLVFLLAFNPAFPTSILAGWNERATPDWSSARELLSPWVEQRSVLLVATSGVTALYYLGRYDIEYSINNVRQIGAGTDFAVDPRTGRVVIGSAGSLKDLISCYSSGLVVDSLPEGNGSPYGLDAAAVLILEEHTRELSLPDHLGMRAFVWDRSPGSGGSCSSALGETDY